MEKRSQKVEYKAKENIFLNGKKVTKKLNKTKIIFLNGKGHKKVEYPTKVNFLLMNRSQKGKI